MKKHIREDGAMILSHLTDEEAKQIREEWKKYEPGEISIVSLESEVKILKEKKGVPTVIEWNGKRYILHHADQLKR